MTQVNIANFKDEYPRNCVKYDATPGAGPELTLIGEEKSTTVNDYSNDRVYSLWLVRHGGVCALIAESRDDGSDSETNDYKAAEDNSTLEKYFQDRLELYLEFWKILPEDQLDELSEEFNEISERMNNEDFSDF